ncbi:MAG: YkgJ family cysteine cluster protein [Proteobacteria bacterium]|nr:MAG: YkgJ family cysteine cluster protein [Pseudomonadota bacterium]
MGTLVARPVVRSFSIRHSRECAAWVKQGGHAVLWEKPGRGMLVLPVPDESDPADLSLFSILDLGKRRWKVPAEGPLRGLATCLVPKDCNWIVQRRIDRDSQHESPTREIEIDCLECGACCEDNEVLIFDVDEKRFAEAGRLDLLKPPYTRRTDGKLVLTLLKNKKCRHLASDNKCGIYTFRADACRDFPVASECCLYARELERNLYDGVRPEA